MSLMKFTRSLILTATVLSAGALFAQNPKVRATVPFAFAVTGAEMPAGQYEVTVKHVGSAHYVEFRNVATNRSAVVLAQVTAATAPSSVQFRCANETCAIAAVAAGNGSVFSVPVRPIKDEKDRNGIVATTLRTIPAGF